MKMKLETGNWKLGSPGRSPARVQAQAAIPDFQVSSFKFQAPEARR